MRTITRLIASATLLIDNAGGAGPTAIRLTQGKRVEERVSAASRYFTVQVPHGQAAWVTVWEGESDLEVRVRPGRSSEADRVNGFEEGREAVTLIAPPGATDSVVFTLEVRCSDLCEAGAHFEIALAPSHDPGVADHTRLDAAAISTQAKDLAREGTTPSLRASADMAANAAEKWKELGEPEYQAAQIEHVGVARYDLDEFKPAEAEFRRALDLVRGRAWDEANQLNNIALCRRSLGAVDEAMRLFRQATRKWEQLPVRSADEASTLGNLGLLLCETGDCNEALAFHRRSIAIFSRLNRPLDLAIALQNLAGAYSGLGDNDSASDYYDRSLALFRRAGAPVKEAIARSNLGFVKMEQRRFDGARLLEEQALGLLKEDNRTRANVLTALCRAKVLSSHSDDALRDCEEAIAVYAKNPYPRGEAYAEHHLGMALAALGRNGPAEADLRKAVELRRSIKDEAGLIASLTGLSLAEARLGRPTAALTIAKEAVEHTESIRSRVAADNLRTSLFATKQASFEACIEILMLLHRDQPDKGYDAQAFEVAERGRARTLLDLLGEARNQIRSGIPATLAEKEASTMRRLNYLTLRGTAQGAELEEALHDYEAAEADIRQADPRYAQILGHPPPKLEDIQRELGEADALLEYSLGDVHSYLWVVTRDRLHAIQLPARDQLDRRARRMASLSANWKDRARDAGELRGLAAWLKRELLGPAGALIQGRRLLIVPDGGLEYIPFASLLSDRVEVATLPSATCIVMHRRDLRNRPRAPGLVAILADPVFGTQAGLPRLVFSRIEAEGIAAMVPARSRFVGLGSDASKAAFLNPRMGQYRYIHVATHAIVNGKRPEVSMIALSRVDGHGRARDGNVHLYEIYNMRLSADLVVLSACSTADGKEMRGEGLVGLTQGFLFAGARSVLVTLWAVDDEGTSVFMKEFYARLLGKGKMTPIAALRGAQRAMAAQARWHDPYYWAGFELQGDWR